MFTVYHRFLYWSITLRSGSGGLISFAKIIELSYRFLPSNDVSHRFFSRTLIGNWTTKLNGIHIERCLIYQSQILRKHELLQSRVLAFEVSSHATLPMSK